MKKYRVVIDITHKEWYVVEAANEEDAKEKALELSEEGDDIEAAVESIGDMFVSDIRVIEELKE